MLKQTFVPETSSSGRWVGFEAHDAEGILDQWQAKHAFSGETDYSFRAGLLSWLGAPDDVLPAPDAEVLDELVKAAGPDVLTLERTEDKGS
jgi:hypothetical protein